MPSVAAAVVVAFGMYVTHTNALEMGTYGRRDILRHGSIALTVGEIGPSKVSASFPQEDIDDDLSQVFQWVSSTKKKAKPPTIEWCPTSNDFSKLRYSTSSLSTKEAAVPESTCTSLLPLPPWMEGHWLTTYKFDGVSFPNGRDQITLTLPGAGLGTCAILPNVGASPAPFVQRFRNSGYSFESKIDDGTRFVVEDIAYNLPRKFEGFWPTAKVESIRVSTSPRAAELSPSCLVSGEGCSIEENPYLHDRHATRCQMEFQGPTRRGGMRTQHLDMTMVDSTSTSGSIPSESNDEFQMARSFVQFNPEQELTSYYREFVSYKKEQSDSGEKIKGKICVAAFLPSTQQAVALYSYNMGMDAISEDEAMMV